MRSGPRLRYANSCRSRPHDPPPGIRRPARADPRTRKLVYWRARSADRQRPVCVFGKWDNGRKAPAPEPRIRGRMRHGRYAPTDAATNNHVGDCNCV